MELMTELLRLIGRSKISVWKSGVLYPLILSGKSIKEAQELSKHALIYTNIVNNLITTTGKQLVGDVLIDDESLGLTYHAIGTGTSAPDITDTTLTTEVARKQVTDRDRSSNQITVSTFYLTSECTYNIKEAGIFGGSTASGIADSGVMFSHYLQEYDNSGGTYDLTFDYTLTIG